MRVLSLGMFIVGLVAAAALVPWFLDALPAPITELIGAPLDSWRGPTYAILCVTYVALNGLALARLPGRPRIVAALSPGEWVPLSVDAPTTEAWLAWRFDAATPVPRGGVGWAGCRYMRELSLIRFVHRRRGQQASMRREPLNREDPG